MIGAAKKPLHNLNEQQAMLIGKNPLLRGKSQNFLASHLRDGAVK
jgi:hypothetical protein